MMGVGIVPDQHQSIDGSFRVVQRALRAVRAAPAVTLLWLATSLLLAQGETPVVTHVAAIMAHPEFYNGRTVRIQGLLEATDDRWRLEGLGDLPLRMVAPGIPLTARRVDVVGQVLDIGRLRRDDPRLGIAELKALLPAPDDDDWPNPGDLVVCVAHSVATAVSFPAPSIRAIVLDPARYLDTPVTVSGQFRGRNLFGDLPEAIGFDRGEFVLANGGGSIWVTHARPRGQGFSFDPAVRADTGKWLEVEGTVHHRGGILWIEGRAVRLTQPAPAAPELPPGPPAPRPNPEVLFSVPSEGETDVKPGTSVRIQVSRTLDPLSFAGHIKVAYQGAAIPAGDEAKGEPPSFTTTYDPVNLVIEIHFTRPLQHFRMVQIELNDGITSPDKTPLKPWSLTFSMGG